MNADLNDKTPRIKTNVKNGAENEINISSRDGFRCKPLRHLPPAQRFQIMVFLSIMWSTIFCAGAGAWLWYGELIVLHVLVAFGVLATGFTFHRASRVKTYRDHPADDGTTRYDDVWGA